MGKGPKKMVQSVKMPDTQHKDWSSDLWHPQQDARYAGTGVRCAGTGVRDAGTDLDSALGKEIAKETAGV